MKQLFSFKSIEPQERSRRIWPYEIQDALLNIQNTASNTKDQIRAEHIIKIMRIFYLWPFALIQIFLFPIFYYNGISGAKDELINKAIAACANCSNTDLSRISQEIHGVHPVVWDGWYDAFWGVLAVFYFAMSLYTIYWWWQAKRLIKSQEPKRRELFM